MSQTKKRLNFLGLWDQQVIVDKLEAMAAQGWMIQKMGTFFWTYRKTQPKKLRFWVTYFPTASPYDPAPTQGQLDKEALCAQDGWQLAVRWDVMQVFYTDREDAVPIDTDPELQVETVRRAYFRRDLPSRSVTMLLCGFYIFMQLWDLGRDPVEFLSSNYHLFALPCLVVLLLLYLGGTVRDLFWLRSSARAAREEGTFLLRRAHPWVEQGLAGGVILLLVFALMGTAPGSLLLWIWMGAMVLLACGLTLLTRGLKRAGVGRDLNRTVTTVAAVVLTLGIMVGLVALGITGIIPLEESQPVGQYDAYGYSRDLYQDDLPLKVEDLVPLEAQWSRRADRKASFLLSREEYREDLISGQGITNYEMAYTLYRPANRWVYDTVRRGLLNSRQDEVGEGYVFTDHYQQIDPTPWGAQEAYQLYWSDSILDTYLVCWEDRILEIKFYWQPTPDQIARAAQILQKA